MADLGKKYCSLADVGVARLGDADRADVGARTRAVADSPAGDDAATCGLLRARGACWDVCGRRPSADALAADLTCGRSVESSARSELATAAALGVRFASDADDRDRDSFGFVSVSK